MTGCVLNFINLWYGINENGSFSPYMIKWAYWVKDFSNRLYILFLYTIYYGLGKYYFECFFFFFFSYERCRLVRIISKVVMLLYLGAACYVVSLLHWKFRKQRVSPQESDLVHASTLLPKYTWFDSNCLSRYEMHFKHQRRNIF